MFWVLVNLQKEYAVGEPRQRIDLAIAVRKPSIRTPFAHNRSSQAHRKPSTIEQHVDAVRQ